MKFEFNEWKELYATDPDAFEVKRIDALQGYIDSVEEKGRKALEQTLFRIEMTRKRSKSPLQSAIEASRLMWESFDKLKGSLEEFQSAAQQLEDSAKANHVNASNTLRLVGADDLANVESDSQPTVRPQPIAESLPKASVIQFRPR
ncbi:DUF3135 domain-containing protein [Limnobacter litoralis]|uniref:DUF3135 domain-containing protein n=1 Tax=Limnobacter litoralis TaxID=481366 RepID=A0ABQ5YNX1_9BURK|nr:DUF3135 domain-containing protein [Limnobacter litoralis]GLR26300.1 hypothetical protein GCM10007875_13900 [Limnobacter litoralis]